MPIKPGWTGRVFEDFAVGDIYEHPLGRTILEADNIWFSCLTMNTNPIHFDGEYAARTEFKKRLVNSCFTLSLVTGQSVTDLTLNGVANLGWDEVKLPHPVFEGEPLPPPGGRTLLFFGLIRDYKGLDVLLDALPEIPDAQLIVFPDANHGSFYQYPDLFVAYATTFLDA